VTLRALDLIERSNEARLREDIRRDALGQSLDAKGTQAVLHGLATAGWLRLRSTKTAGRTRQRWQVNPLLHEGAESAETAQRVLDGRAPRLSALSAGNKMARIAWALLAKGGTYQAPLLAAAA
jgi:hypothetical protein